VGLSQIVGEKQKEMVSLLAVGDEQPAMPMLHGTSVRLEETMSNLFANYFITDLYFVGFDWSGKVLANWGRT
jgi:hypothetical protein